MSIITRFLPTFTSFTASFPVISAEHQSEEIRHVGAVIDIINEKTFGSPEWKKTFGVDIPYYEGWKIKIFEFLIEPDALNKKLRNYQTHMSPIFCPQFIKKSSCHVDNQFPLSEENFESIPYNLQTLLTLTKIQQLETFIFETIIPSITESPGWLIVRKDLLFRGLSTEEQLKEMKKLNKETSVGYQSLPSVLQIATVSLIHHVIHNKCFFGDKGIANPVSLCKKLALKKKYHFLHGMFLKNAHVGCFCSTKKCHEIWNGLDFDTLQNIHYRHGVMAVKKIIALPTNPYFVEKEDDDGWLIVNNCKEIVQIQIQDV